MMKELTLICIINVVLLTLVVCAGGFGVVIATVVMVKCLFLILSSFVVSI